jgi:hypothetical protein
MSFIICSIRLFWSVRFRRGGRNLQCMDICVHECAQRIINQAMSFQMADAGKALGDDPHRKMTSAVSRAGMSGMKMTIVLDFEQFRLERAFELFAYHSKSLGCQGATCTKGLITTLPKTPSVT